MPGKILERDSLQLTLRLMLSAPTDWHKPAWDAFVAKSGIRCLRLADYGADYVSYYPYVFSAVFDESRLKALTVFITAFPNTQDERLTSTVDDHQSALTFFADLVSAIEEVVGPVEYQGRCDAEDFPRDEMSNALARWHTIQGIVRAEIQQHEQDGALAIIVSLSER